MSAVAGDLATDWAEAAAGAIATRAIARGVGHLEPQLLKPHREVRQTLEMQ